MKKRTDEFLSIKDALHDMLQENKLQHGIDEIDVQKAWKAVMGKGVSSYTIQVELKNKTLLIKLTSSTLREELSYGKEKIIQMMNENLKKTVINKVKLL